MGPDLKPSKLGPDQPYLAMNVRLEGGEAVLRGGQDRVINVADRKIVGLGTQKIGRNALNGGPSIFLDRSIFNPNFGTRPWRWNGADPGFGPGATYGDDILGFTSEDSATDIALARYVGNSEVYFDGSDHGPLWELLVETPRPARLPGSLHYGELAEQGSDFFFNVVDHNVGTQVAILTVYKFDGVTITVDKEINFGVTVSPGAFVGKMIPYRNKLVMIFNTPTNAAYVRAADGTWSGPLTPAAGLLSVENRYRAVQFQNQLYIPDADTATGDAFSMSAANVFTRLPRATTGIDATGYIKSFAVLNRVLYYVWEASGFANFPTWIGKFDGTTWTPKYVNLLTQLSYPAYQNQNPTPFVPTDWRIGDVPEYCRISYMLAYRGSLALVASGVGLYLCPKGDPLGTWKVSVSDFNTMDKAFVK